MSNNGYASASSLATVASSGEYSDLLNIPADADTLAALGCAGGEYAMWDGSAWDCGVPTDNTLDETQVDSYVSNNGYALSTGLATVASSGEYSDLLNIPSETLTGLSCVDGGSPVWNDTLLLWECALVDTVLTESEVEGFITNGAIELAAGTTIEGAGFLTGADDGDGFSEAEGDCDEGNPAINPAATDMLGDGYDQNCDGIDGTDGDGDGYASTASGGTDCDDANAQANPGITEVPGDGVDQNCNGIDQHWIAMGAKEDASCAVSSDGKIQCFGGYDLVDDEVVGYEPAGTFSQVSLGAAHACAIDSLGAITCWGVGPTLASWTVPAPTSGSYTKIASSSGCCSAVSCALDTAGALTCFGGGSSPLLTGAPTGAYSDLDIGYQDACLVDVSGAIECWGSDQYGVVSGAPNGSFTAVGTSDTNACAIDPSGSIQCWGGGATEHVVHNIPSGTFTDVVVGYEHACALTPLGTIRCWGTAEFGQLSNIPSGAGHTRLVASDYSTLALDENGRLYCWGYAAPGNCNIPQ